MISFLFALLIVLVIGAMPLWPYSRTWGYYPSGLVAVTLSVLILLAISGRLGINTRQHGQIPDRRPWMAKKRGGRKYGKKASEKVEKVMRERKRGTLRSGGSGKKVTSRKQAIAIGLSEARRAGAKVPRKRTRRTQETLDARLSRSASRCRIFRQGRPNA